jgi:capsular polysaccharide export protein
MAPAIEQVLACFARNAPPDDLLVVTEHPLDSGVFDLGAVTRACAARLGIGGRVLFLQGGSPGALLCGSRGVVTVNSTLGLLALGHGVAVKVLGHAVYDLPGLTDQQPLAHFWRGATAPDPLLFDAFRRVLVSRAQINGGLYSRVGLELAAAAGAQRLCAAAPACAPHGLRQARAEAELAPAPAPCAPGGNFGLSGPQ